MKTGDWGARRNLRVGLCDDFSAGAHHCVGASLARLEGEVAFNTFATMMPTLRLTGRPRRGAHELLRGFDRIPAAG